MSHTTYLWDQNLFWRLFLQLLIIGVGLMSCQKDESELNKEPARPKNLTIEQVNKGLQLSWNIIINTNTEDVPDQYHVYRFVNQTEDEQHEKKIAIIEQLQFVDADVEPNQTYVYSVSGVKLNEDGEIESARSERMQAVFATAIPKIDSDLIDFSEIETKRTLTIQNQGKADLHWSVSFDMDWVTATPTRGTITAQSELVIVLTADRRHDPGRLGATLTFQAFAQKVSGPSNKPTFEKKINVQLIIPPKPLLTIAPNSIDFGLSRKYQMVKVFNTGSGRLDWRAEKVKSSDWLHISPMQGSVMAGEAELFKVRINDDALGDFPAGFQITETVKIQQVNNQEPDVGMVPDLILRSLFITVKIPQPMLKLSTKNIDFGEKQDRLPLVIDNIGTGQFGWQISGGANWLHYKPETGLTDIDLDRVELVIDRHQLAIDDYTSEILVQTRGPAGYSEQQRVQIRMRVGEAPEVNLSSTKFNFGTKQLIDNFTITNIGTGRLEWKIEMVGSTPGSIGWLTISPANGLIRTETVPIQLNVDRTNLAAGEYTVKLMVRAKKANTKQIAIKMSVPRSELKLSTTAADFGTGFIVDLEQLSRLIKFHNQGQAVIDWQLSSSTEWIGLRYQQKNTSERPLIGKLLAKTSDNVEVFLQKLEGLPTGQHQGGIEISDGTRLQKIQVFFNKVGQISGTVFDLETRRILPLAQVNLKTNDGLKKVIKTDNTGQFQLPFGRDGRYQISVQAEGHVPRTEIVTTRLGYAKIDFNLSPLLNRVAVVKNGLHSPKQLVSDGQNRLYISNQISGTITVLNNLKQPKEIVLVEPTICQPASLALWRNQLLVSLSGIDQMVIIDTQSREEIHRFAVGDYPDHCQISDNRMYVALRRENKIAVIDLTIPARKYRIPVSREPGPMVIDTNQSSLYVCNTSDNTVSVVDLQVERELYRIRVGQKPNQIALGNKLNNGQQYLYVVNSLSGDVSLIQTENRLEVKRLRADHYVVVIAIQPLSSGREILYTVGRDGTVSALEMPRQTVVRDMGFNLSTGANSGIYDPATNQIYILHQTNRQLTVLSAQ